MVSSDSWRRFPKLRLFGNQNQTWWLKSGAMTHWTWWAFDPWRRTLNNMKLLQSSYWIPNANNLLVYPARSLETLHIHIIHIIALQVHLLQVSHIPRCLFQQWLLNKQSKTSRLKTLNSNKCFWLWLRGKRTWRLFFSKIRRKSPRSQLASWTWEEDLKDQSRGL